MDKGQVFVEGCWSKWCIKKVGKEVFFCEGLRRLLPVDKERIIVYCGSIDEVIH